MGRYPDDNTRRSTLFAQPSNQLSDVQTVSRNLALSGDVESDLPVRDPTRREVRHEELVGKVERPSRCIVVDEGQVNEEKGS